MRKTECRLPAGFEAADLGEASVSEDGRCVLISFVTAPVVVARENEYVLLVVDTVLASTAHSFEWTFKENDDVTRVDVTKDATIIYRPSDLGKLSVSVRVLDVSEAERAVVLLEQEVVPPSTELEAFIAAELSKPGPGATDPEVVRELVNEHGVYYQSITSRGPEASDGFSRFLFSMVAAGVSRYTAAERRQHISQLAGTLDDHSEEFLSLAAKGTGVCNIRLALLAMVMPRAGRPTPFLAWRELPEPTHQRRFADEELQKILGALDDDEIIDLFNMVRFPKSNIASCARILEALRDRYFPKANFDDVLAGLSGTRAHWLVRHFREGPLAKA